MFSVTEADDYVNWVGWVGGLVQTVPQLQTVILIQIKCFFRVGRQFFGT